MIRILQSLIFILMFSLFVSGQTTNLKSPASKIPATLVKSSAAYTEIILKRTELEAELEDLLVNYTREYPKVKEIQFQLDKIKEAFTRLFNLDTSDSGKLTEALGKLILQKIELETEFGSLQNKYNDDHPEIKKIKRKILVYESAIKDVLF